MLDTNMVSYILKGRSARARAKLAQLLGDESACISAITHGELLYGMVKAGFGIRQRTAVEGFLSRIETRSWDIEAASAYGPLRSQREAAGKTLGPLDMQIAAHSIAVGAILVSNDLAFRNVPDLVGLENWAGDL